MTSHCPPPLLDAIWQVIGDFGLACQYLRERLNSRAPTALPLLTAPQPRQGVVLSFIAIWMGAAAAHNARGWRSIILPFLGVFFAILVPVLVQMMVSGALFSLESVLTQLGLMR